MNRHQIGRATSEELESRLGGIESIVDRASEYTADELSADETIYLRSLSAEQARIENELDKRVEVMRAAQAIGYDDARRSEDGMSAMEYESDDERERIHQRPAYRNG